MVFRLLATTERGAKYPDAHQLGNGSHPDKTFFFNFANAIIQKVINVSINVISKVKITTFELESLCHDDANYDTPRCKTMPTPPRNGMVVVPQVSPQHLA